MSTTPDSLRAELATMGKPAPRRTEAPNERAACFVASRVLERWRAAGVTHATLDAQGAPVPVVGEVLHRSEVVTGRTSPSGKTLFTCRGCGQEGTGPVRGPCPGRPVYERYQAIVGHLCAGGGFELDAAGVLRPTAPARAAC